MPDPLIDEFTGYTWQNFHCTRGVGGTPSRFFTPRNTWADGSTTPGKPFAPGLAGLQRLVQRAETDGKRIRAAGSGWSLSPVAYVDDYLVNTSRLNVMLLGFKTPSLVHSRVRASSDRLVFAQCGTAIKSLNNMLEANGLALPTTGASNGQTIAGATSTGTHGSAHEVGAVHDIILGIHLIGPQGRPIWLERPSKPTMTADFAAWLGAEFVQDEDLFLAAVVGLGSLGLVHALMFMAEPLYLLELFVRQLDYSDVVEAACSRTVEGLGFPYGAEMPFHFEVVLNPYLRGRGQGGAFVRVLYKRPLVGPPPVHAPPNGGTIFGQDLVALAGHLTDAAPALVPGLLQGQLLEAVAPTGTGTTLVRTPGVQFGDSEPTNGGTSMELGVPLDRLHDSLEATFSVTDKKAFGAPLALRYLQASEALLAFSCHRPTTCTMEFPGVDSDTARGAHLDIISAIRSRGVPVTCHFGQHGDFSRASIVAGHGQDRVDRWVGARRGFLSTPAARWTFSNQMLEQCGLDT